MVMLADYRASAAQHKFITYSCLATPAVIPRLGEMHEV